MHSGSIRLAVCLAYPASGRWPEIAPSLPLVCLTTAAALNSARGSSLLEAVRKQYWNHRTTVPLPKRHDTPVVVPVGEGVGVKRNSCEPKVEVAHQPLRLRGWKYNVKVSEVATHLQTAMPTGAMHVLLCASARSMRTLKALASDHLARNRSGAIPLLVTAVLKASKGGMADISQASTILSTAPNQ